MGCFISCLDSHSDGTHSLQRIHWWASDVMLNFSKSVPMKKRAHLHLGWPEGEYIFSKFWVNCSFKDWNITLNHISSCSARCPSPPKSPLNILESPLHASGIFIWSCCLGQKAVNSCCYEQKPNLYSVTIIYQYIRIYVILALTFGVFQSQVCSLLLKAKQWTYLLMRTQATSKFFNSSWFIIR